MVYRLETSGCAASGGQLKKADQMNETPTTQERYAIAIRSSSLRVQATYQGDADYLIAAGWSKSRFGAALMRLHSEWDLAERRGCQIPRQATRRQIAQLAREIATQQKAGKVTEAHSAAARQRLEEGFVAELKETMRVLRTLPEVRLHMELRSTLDGKPEVGQLCCAVLLHWLKPSCPICNGRKFQLKPWTDELSGNVCGGCAGTGQVSPPGGDEGRALLSYLDDCVNIARQSIRARIFRNA